MKTWLVLWLDNRSMAWHEDREWVCDGQITFDQVRQYALKTFVHFRIIEKIRTDKIVLEISQDTHFQ